MSPAESSGSQHLASAKPSDTVPSTPTPPSASSEALLVTDERFRATFNQAAAGMAIASMDGLLAEVNSRFVEIIGYSPEELQSLTFMDLTHPDDATRTRALVTQLLAGTINDYALEKRYLHKNGTTLWSRTSVTLLKDTAGRPARFIGVIEDISQRKHAEEALRKSEQRLRFLDSLNEATRALNSPGAILEVSARLLGSHLHVSRCAYAEVEADGERFTIVGDYTDGCASTAGNYQLSLFGPRAATAMRAGRTLVIHDVDRELTPEEGAAMFNAIQVKAIACFPLVKDGHLRAMMAVHQTQPRVWTEDELSLVREVVERCWSILERARAENALRVALEHSEFLSRGLAEAAERFRLLPEVVSLQVWTAGLDGQLDFANQECAKYFGVTSLNQILGNAWAKFVHPEDLPHAVQSWQTSLTTGCPYDVEFRLRGADGEYRWFLVRAQAMRDADGRITRWFGTNTNTDGLKRAQREAEQASRAKDDFLAALSHELRTPLTPVLLSAAALREDERLSADIRAELAMMERNIALEARLIDDLLDLTSISRGKLTLRKEACDAHALIDRALEIVNDDASRKEIALRREYAATHTGITADPTRIQQVIWNLLRNAVKFTPAAGRITVRTRDARSVPANLPVVQIEIADSGIGIDSTALEKIFQPFEQAAHAGDHRFGGMGLGLAIARAIVAAHGGKISAHSDGVDKGSTFIIELPAVSTPARTRSSFTAAAPTPRSTPPIVPTPGQRASRIFLVEDHADSAAVLARMLRRAGYEVIQASTVGAALVTAEKEMCGTGIDLVISDLGLPDGSGLDLMRQLSSKYQLRGIALSGFGMESDLAQSRAAGFARHLIKPIDVAAVRAAIAELLQNPN